MGTGFVSAEADDTFLLDAKIQAFLIDPSAFVAAVPVAAATTLTPPAATAPARMNEINEELEELGQGYGIWSPWLITNSSNFICETRKEDILLLKRGGGMKTTTSAKTWKEGRGSPALCYKRHQLDTEDHLPWHTQEPMLDILHV